VKDKNNFNSNQDLFEEYEMIVRLLQFAKIIKYETQQLVKIICEYGKSIYLVFLKAHKKFKKHKQMDVNISHLSSCDAICETIG